MSALEIGRQEREGIAILAPRGKITIGRGANALRNAVQSALEDGARNLLIDLGHVTTLDSSGMAELVAALSTVKQHGGALKLVNLPPKIRDIFGITRLETLFETFEDEQRALASYQN